MDTSRAHSYTYTPHTQEYAITHTQTNVKLTRKHERVYAYT